VFGVLLLASGCGDDGPKAATSTSKSATTSTTSDESTTTEAPRKPTPRLTSPTYSTTAPVASSNDTTPTTEPPAPVPSDDTIATDPVVTRTCDSNDTALAEAVITHLKASQPTVPASITGITHAPSDAAWARADVTSETPDGLVGMAVITHCVGSQWNVIEAGLSAVGCSGNVPEPAKSQITLGCTTPAP
jgi:hypothetical protein